VEAFIAAELERTGPSSAATATARYSSSSSGWTRARSADRRWSRCVLRSSRAAGARPTGRPGPGPACCLLGQGLPRPSLRRDHPAVRRYRMRLEGMGGLGYSADDPDRYDWTCDHESCASSRRADVRWSCPSEPRPRATLTGLSPGDRF